MDEGNMPLRRISDGIAVIIRLGNSPRLATVGDVAPLDRSAYLLLRELEERGATAINVLADALRLDISTASRQVAALEDKALVTRFRDPVNRRISIVELTPEGSSRLHEVQSARDDLYREILHNWTEEECSRFADDLERLIHDIKHRPR